MTSRVIVTLERAGKIQYIVMREDDYAASVKFTKGNEPRMLYGKGAMWAITAVKPEKY